MRKIALYSVPEKILSCLNIGFIPTFWKKLTENLAKIASEPRVLEANLVREVFCAQSVTKMVRTWKFFERPQYRLHTDLSKEAYAENLAKIASELSFLEPI